MMEKPMVIVGGEEVTFSITNTFTSRLIRIKYDEEKNCKILLGGYKVSDIDLTDKCKRIEVIDHIAYRRINREVAITVGEDVFWGKGYRYAKPMDNDIQIIQHACKDLGIEYEYRQIEDYIPKKK